MKFLKTLGLILLILMLIVCALLMGLRFAATKASDKAAVAAAMATPEPTPTPEIFVTPEPTAEPSPTPEPTPEITPEPTPGPDSPEGRALALGLPKPPEIDVDSWEYTLVNGEHSIGEYAPETIAYLNQTLTETDVQTVYNGNRCPVDVRIADALIEMGLACKNAGNTVFLSSGYRSYSEQAQNFVRVCQNNGVSDGKDANGHYITMPAGCSEHQLALCCDVTDVYRPIKNAEIANTATYKWLSEHCAEYGFVVRFPSGKEDITGVMFEPFHFRYVGTEVAAYMMDNELCLEEFLSLYGIE